MTLRTSLILLVLLTFTATTAPALQSGPLADPTGVTVALQHGPLADPTGVSVSLQHGPLADPTGLTLPKLQHGPLADPTGSRPRAKGFQQVRKGSKS